MHAYNRPVAFLQEKLLLYFKVSREPRTDTDCKVVKISWNCSEYVSSF
jgi:hypothetical protein